MRNIIYPFYYVAMISEDTSFPNNVDYKKCVWPSSCMHLSPNHLIDKAQKVKISNKLMMRHYRNYLSKTSYTDK